MSSWPAGTYATPGKNSATTASAAADGPAVRSSANCNACGAGRCDATPCRTRSRRKTTHYYGHPEGYRIEGMGRAAIDDVRKEVVKRHEVITLSHDELLEELEAE